MRLNILRMTVFAVDLTFLGKVEGNRCSRSTCCSTKSDLMDSDGGTDVGLDLDDDKPMAQVRSEMTCNAVSGRLPLHTANGGRRAALLSRMKISGRNNSSRCRCNLDMLTHITQPLVHRRSHRARQM